MTGRVVTIPLAPLGPVALWAAAVGLLVWTTLGGPEDVAFWGLLVAVGAMTWTVVYAQKRSQDLLVKAFELGRTTGLRNVSRSS